MLSDSARFPKAMRSLPNWVLWKFETKKGRKTKVPYNALYHEKGRKASSKDSSTWTTFEKALKAFEAHPDEYSGIGFEFAKKDGLVFVDIDHCLDADGLPDDRAEHILSEIGENAFIEKSVSGTGLHLFVRGSIPRSFKNSEENVEMYDNGRFCAMTGNVFTDHDGEPTANEEALRQLFEEYKTKKKEEEGHPTQEEEHPSRYTDEEVIRKAGSDPTSGAQFERLFSGDISGYPSHSEADARLCQILAFWCSKDREQMLRIWRASKLWRDKSERADYQESTIRIACDSVKEDLDEWQERKRTEDLLSFTDSLDEQQKLILDRIERLQPDTDPKYNKLDDVSDGELFADVFRNEARYNTSAREWYIYDGIVWKKDEGGLIVARYAEMLYKALYIYYANKSQSHQKHAVKMANYGIRKRMIEDAKKHHPISHEMLDADPNLLNCKNGILRLDSLELIPHDASFLLSKCANVIYDPDVESLEWLSCVEAVMCEDEEKIRYLQKTLGIGLTCNTSEEECYIFYGATTRNGKSTMLETVSCMMGDYAMNMNPETLAHKRKDGRQASGDIARLSGCRFLRMSEPPKSMMFDTALLKTFLGRDTLTARNLFEKEFEFIPEFTLYINTNHLPIVNDDTVFSSGRIKVIKFDRHFEEREQDKHLKERLKREYNLSGVLNWCLDGLRAYRKEGLTPPECVLDATREYRERSDKLSLFIEDVLIPDKDGIIARKALYRQYKEWCRLNSYGEESMRTFADELKARGMHSDTGTIDGKTVKNVIKGYRINYYDFEEDPEAGTDPE